MFILADGLHVLGQDAGQFLGAVELVIFLLFEATAEF